MKRIRRCPYCGKKQKSDPDLRKPRGGFQIQCSNCGKTSVFVRPLYNYLHFDLLDFADSHLEENETRAAVVEAFTAVDVFSRRWAKAALKSIGTPEKVISYITVPKRTRTRNLISMINEIFRKNNFPQFPQKILSLRNVVIHEGKIPTKSETTEILKKARYWIQHTQYASRADFEELTDPKI